MDNVRSQPTPSTQPARRTTPPVAPPPENGPKRFTFRIRRRGFTFEGTPSLLLTDRLGVWSVTNRRYIRKTRLHRYCELRRDLNPVNKTYKALVREHGMDKWPEFRRVAGEVAALRQRLVDMYWDARPEEMKAETIRFYRERRRRARRARCLARVAAPAVVMAAVGFLLLRAVLLGWCGGWASLCMGAAYLVAVYLLDMVLWDVHDRSSLE